MPLQITKRADNYVINTLENNISEQDVISGFMKILPLEDEQVKILKVPLGNKQNHHVGLSKEKGR